MAKTHYCGIDYPNESDNNYYYTPTVCGLDECESPMTDKECEVTCKNCLRVLAKHKIKAKAALPLPVVVHCPNCNGTNIENPMYNDYYCTDCNTPFD